jgi:hypothetical protein
MVAAVVGLEVEGTAAKGGRLAYKQCWVVAKRDAKASRFFVCVCSARVAKEMGSRFALF